MKKNVFILCLLLLAVSGFAQSGFKIRGDIRGNADGMKVYLQDFEWPEPNTIDSAIIENGKFLLKGSVEVPAIYGIYIDKTPSGQPSSQRNYTSSRFYLENANITFSGNIDSLPAYFYSNKPSQKAVITGSATETESQDFQKLFSDLRKESAKLDKEYGRVFHMPALNDTFNTKEGMELAGKLKEIGKKMNDIRWNYIKENPRSVISYDEAMNYFRGMSVNLSSQEIDELLEMIGKGWAGTPQMAKLKEAAEKSRKYAIGQKYMDFELTTPSGKKAKISSFIPEGKYVMLEFWASWCGPCRGEIPHLKNAYKNKPENFELISISLDESDADWKKAMKDEKMPWPQLVSYEGFEAPVARAYNILGIPYSLLLNKDGKIIATNLRGAYLDLELERM